MELDLHFHKLLKKETEIDHSCLKSNQNKLKYLLLNAPQKVLECLFEQFDLHLIYGLVKKLYPFTSSTINHQDKTKIKNVLRNFINGKPKSTDRVNESSKNLETLNKKAEEEILVVILYNTDTALAQRLIRGRISKMIFKKEGIKEFFCIFEKLLISPESIYNIIEKYLLNLNHLKCTLDEMILISLNDVKDSIKINKANRYGVLTVKGYKEFFNFFEKFIFILINNFFRITMKNKQKIEEFGSHILKGNFLKYYDHLRDNLIKDLRSSLPLIFKEHGQVKEGDSNYLIKRVFLESLFNLEKELFMLYKKQKTWLQKRIVENNILKDHIFIKEVKNTHLNDKTFNSEVIQPVISRINQILGKEKVKAQILKPPSLDPTNQPSNSNSPHDIENVKENLQKRNRLSSTQSTVNFKETGKLKRVKQDI